MNRTQRDIAVKPQPAIPGVIDTIAHGLSVALAQPWLFLLPMVLDAWYWAGPKISISAITNPVSSWVLRQDSTDVERVAKEVDKIGRSDAGWLLSTFTPSFLSGMPRTEVYEYQARSIFTPSPWWFAILVMLGLVLASGLIAMIFTVPISNAATDRRQTASQLLRSIGVAWIRFFALLGLVLGLALLLFGPLSIVTMILLVVGVNAVPLLTLVAGLFFFFVLFILWFAPDAIVVSRVGPVNAVKYSLLLVRRFFWQSVGLTSASLVITLGLAGIWEKMADSAPGLLFGVIANAFISTGLAIASMTFYANRMRSLIPGSVPGDERA